MKRHSPFNNPISPPFKEGKIQREKFNLNKIDSDRRTPSSSIWLPDEIQSVAKIVSMNNCHYIKLANDSLSPLLEGRGDKGGGADEI